MRLTKIIVLTTILSLVLPVYVVPDGLHFGVIDLIKEKVDRLKGKAKEKREEIVRERGKIAFISKRDNDKGEIYLMNIDGSGVKRLTYNSKEEEGRLQFSPDGEKIIFKREGEIYLLDIDTKEEIRLTNSAVEEWNPSFSPDGEKILFQREEEGTGWSHIYIMNVDGTDKKRIVEGGEFRTPQLPSFSPDGKRILFMEEVGKNNDIYTINLDGTEKRNLTNNPADDTFPIFSPNGTKIAFFSDRDKVNFYEIYVMNQDGSDQRRVTNRKFGFWETHQFPIFSPDGSHIIFQLLLRYEDDWEIFKIGIDGKGEVNLTQNPFADHPFCWMPTGEILFISNREGNFEIYKMDGNGRNVMNLTNDPSDDLVRAFWSPYYRFPY